MGDAHRAVVFVRGGPTAHRGRGPADAGRADDLRVEFDDPRVSGTVTTTGNYDCHAETGCVTWGQQEITGSDGSWSGTFTGLVDPAFTERAVAVFAGSGGYAGLIFVVHGVGPLNETSSVVGLIYEGDAPAPR